MSAAWGKERTMTDKEAKRIVDAISELIIAKVKYYFYATTSHTGTGVRVARSELLAALQDMPTPNND